MALQKEFSQFLLTKFYCDKVDKLTLLYFDFWKYFCQLALYSGLGIVFDLNQNKN